MDSSFLQDIVQQKSQDFLATGAGASEAVHLALGELLNSAGRGLQGLERFAFRARLIAAARVILESQERQDRLVPLNSKSPATRSSAAPRS